MADQAFTQDWHNYSLMDLAPFLRTVNPDKIKTVVEVGSFEGRSLLSWAKMFPYADLHAFDAWKQTSEMTSVGVDMDKVYAKFVTNVMPISHRLITWPGKSRFTLPDYACPPNDSDRCLVRPAVDFAYIDGSHYADDTLLDALNLAPVISQGGYIVFDDYKWNKRKEAHHNPKLAIDAFGQIARGGWERIHENYTVVYRKGPVSVAR
jgi:cephalosporin hydroxylase